MVEPTASRFWQATLQSGLTDEKALRACWEAIPREKRAPEHLDRRLARQAVQSGVLTLWQAQQLIAGRSGGFKIDRYVLIGLIGQGGMGRVYLARDSRLNRRVALKILSPERVNNPRAIARFHREALVGAQLQHESLVRIYDEGESSGRCYLVMEYIEGKNIGQMIAENGPIPAAVSARLGLQVAMGLEHAQRKGLIHRDVNPYNILVTRDGTAKLTDLGLAIDLADQDRVTRDGATVGTFDYVSPEQARHSHSVDTRSDIYSLGCTLYHMLTGRVPFPSASLPEKLFSHQASEPEPITKLAPDVPEGLAGVVSRMMRKSPDDRYATPLELAQALEPFADVTTGSDLCGSARGASRRDTPVTQIATPPSHNGEAVTVL
ncbi:MAG: serine/threonine protein kinase, partial [Planctomycetia bacterium]|nr:serine/threonine protein kinase [Planctomycetia bacterium]